MKRLILVWWAATAVLAAACSAPPELSDLDEARAWEIAHKAYNQGYTDGQFRLIRMGQGARINDTGGLEGDAWRLGYRDALEGRPIRTDPQLRQWIQDQRSR